jgi:hypothetical protein
MSDLNIYDRSALLELLQRCQNGDATCLFTLKEIEGAVDRKLDVEKIKADKLADVLQGIINSACHPEIALRVISVELAPIRKALAEYHKTP